MTAFEGDDKMSRRPQVDSHDTRRKLIASAEEEFAQQGYEKASLRRICSRIGVTTGALYFFFNNKEDLFKNVIQPVTDQAIQILKEYQSRIQSEGVREESDSPMGDAETLGAFFDLMYAHRYVVTIIINNQNSPFVGKFFESFKSVIAATIQAILYPGATYIEPYDSFIIEWLAQTEMTTIIDILRNDKTRQEADGHVTSALVFTQGGLKALANGQF